MKLALAAAAALLAFGAHAQKVYKHVDEKGNVTYSQTPPAADAKAVPVPPPRKLPPSAYGSDEERRAAQRAAMQDRQAEFERRQREHMEAVQEDRRKQIDALRAECVRNRGTDCDDPNTIARMQAERGPSQYRPRAR